MSGLELKFTCRANNLSLNANAFRLCNCNFMHRIYLLLWAPHEKYSVEVFCEVLLCDSMICWLIHILANASRVSFIIVVENSNSNFIKSESMKDNGIRCFHAHAIFLHFHRHLSLFEWSLLILARTLIWNRILKRVTCMQCNFANSHKFKLASMVFSYSDSRNIGNELSIIFQFHEIIDVGRKFRFESYQKSFTWVKTKEFFISKVENFSNKKRKFLLEMELKFSLEMIFLHVFIPSRKMLLMLVMHF